MNIKDNNLLINQQIIFLLIGPMVGVGIFSLPNVLVMDAYEDAWISAILGAAYPLYMAFLAIFLCKKHPKENLLILSKKYCGKIIGGLFNLIFLIHFTFYTAIIISGLTNIILVYGAAFLTPMKIVAILSFIGAFTAYRGLKTLAKINTFSFFLSVILVLSSLSAIKKGSYINLLPFFHVSFINILKNSKNALLAYGGFEIIFLIYPFAKNSKDIRKATLKAIAITAVIYTLITTMTIYYLSVDIVGKSSWSFLTVTESLRIEAINNFIFIFISLWMFIGVKVIANYYYASILIAKDFFYYFSRKSITIISFIIITYIALKLSEETVRKKFIDLVYEKFALYVLIFPSIVSFLALIKKEGKG